MMNQLSNYTTPSLFIEIRVAMSFSKAFDPDTRIAAILLIVYPIAIATGTAPVQLPGHGF